MEEQQEQQQGGAESETQCEVCEASISSAVVIKRRARRTTMISTMKAKAAVRAMMTSMVRVTTHIMIMTVTMINNKGWKAIHTVTLVLVDHSFAKCHCKCYIRVLVEG